MNALQLTSDQVKLLLNFSKGSLKVSDVKAWLRIHETDLDLSSLGNDTKKKNTTTEIHALENESGIDSDTVNDEVHEENATELLLSALADFDESEENLQSEGCILEENEAKEILFTMVRDSKNRSYQGALKAKKNRDLARGFGAGRDGFIKPGNYAVSIEELKKRTKCNRCHRVGHWSRECRQKGTGKTNSKAGDVEKHTKEIHVLDYYPESEFMYLEHTIDEDPSETASASQPGFDHETFDMQVYMVPPPFPCYQLLVDSDLDVGCATIDTGCQRMAIGLNTLKQFQSTQPASLPIHFKKEKHQFRSVHKVSSTERVALIPTCIGPRGSILKPAVFEESHCCDAPFLLSLPFLLHCKCHLDLDEDAGLALVSKKYQFRLRCVLGPTGALRVRLQDFSDDMIQHLSQRMVTDQPEYELLRTEHFSAGSDCAQSYKHLPVPHGGSLQEESCPRRGVQWEDSSPVEADVAPGFGGNQPCYPSHAHAPSQDEGPDRTQSEADLGGCRRDVSHGARSAGEPHDDQVDRPDGQGRQSSISDPFRVVSGDFSSIDGIKLLPRTDDVGDSREDQLGRSTDLRMWNEESNLPLQDQGQLQSVVLEVPSRTEEAMPILSVDPDGACPNRGGDRRGSPHQRQRVLGEDQPVDSVPVLPQQDDQAGKQCIHQQGHLQGVWESFDGREEKPGKRIQDSDNTRDFDFRGRVLSRVPGVHALASDEAEDPRSTGSQPLFPVEESEVVPVGLQRHVFGHLKRAETNWNEVLQLIPEEPVDNPSAPLFTVCKQVREALHKQQGHQLRKFQDIFALSKSELQKVVEICNPGCFGEQIDHFGLRSSKVFDIVLGWDLLRTDVQRHVKDYIRFEKPGLILLAPPCTLFSTLIALSMTVHVQSKKYMDRYLRELQRARRLLKFCADICELCIDIGSTFVFEHPWGASSWSEPCLKSLLQRMDTYLAKTDQCQFGLRASSGQAIRKRTGFLTNDVDIAQELDKTCDESHVHEQIIGRAKGDPASRSQMAQKYPTALICCILGVYATKHGIPQKHINYITAEEIYQQENYLEAHWRSTGLWQQLLHGEPHQGVPDSVLQHAEPQLAEDLPHHEMCPLSIHADASEEVDEQMDETEHRENFPGSHPLSLTALIRRAHEGLGHPGRDRFLRILKASKATKQVLEIAQKMECSVCQKFKRPTTTKAGSPPKEVGINEVVGVDSIQLRCNFSQKIKYCLNIIDYHSHFQLIVPLRDHTAEAARDGYRQWVKIFGPPRKLLLDQGKEFQKQFCDAAEADGTEVVPSSLETPQQRGFVERNGQLFKDMFYKTLEQVQCSDWNEWYALVDTVCLTKNRMMSRGGFSPAQRIFGYQPRIPGGALSEGHQDVGVISRAQAGDVQIQRSMEIRKQAAIAFHEVDCQQALRAAATHGPRPVYDYQVGQAVYFWRRGANASRKPANAFWHGPARVVATQLPTTVWVSYNRHLVKAAPEKLRPASEEEFMSLSGWLEGITQAKQAFQNEKIHGLIDLSQEENPPLIEGKDYWTRQGRQWIRVHQVHRVNFFNLNEQTDEEVPFSTEDIKPICQVHMKFQDGHQEAVEITWERDEREFRPVHGGPWTGTTTFFLLEGPEEEQSKPSEPRVAVPTHRMTKKARLQGSDRGDEIRLPPGLSEPEEHPPEAELLPELEYSPEQEFDPAAVPLPDDASMGLSDPEHPLPEGVDENQLKREAHGESSDGWEPLPESKRSRIQLLELYHLQVQAIKKKPKPGKSKELTMRDFRGKDFERLQQAIHKEINNNNLSTGAYEILTPEDSSIVRRDKGDKIMRSRYVITKKPIEEFDLEDAKSADMILEESVDGPCKAKCRHVMQGFSEPALLELDTSTPQVHRDSVLFTAQIMATKKWTPGFADFTQAFHSGDAIQREIYAEQPKEGIPGVARGQLLRLLKTCYGLTDGPSAWFKHIVRYITQDLGYRQSVIDPCLFFLDSQSNNPEDPQDIDGIIALATDDLLHGGNDRHVEKISSIKDKHKLGKFTWSTGRFVGKDFTQLPDGSIQIDQKFYTNSRVQTIDLSKERKRKRFSYCTPAEIEELRTLAGTLAWLAKETRCDLAGKVALLQQSFPKPQIKDIVFGNQIAREALDHAELGIRMMPIPLKQLRVGVVTDASWGNSREFGTYLEEGTRDYWEETDHCWIRHHHQPRHTAFHPAAAPGGPDLHEIRADRVTHVDHGHKSFPVYDTWTSSTSMGSLSEQPWTGSTSFQKQKEGETLEAKEIHSGYEQLMKLHSQGGEIIMFYDEALPRSQQLQNVSLAAWKSYRLKRRTVNTLSSETQAMVRGMGSVHWFRVLLLEARGMNISARDWQKEVAKLPFICITDSKSLFDAVQKDTNPTTQCDDKRTAIDISLVKQELQELGGTIRWIDGRTMISDSLTKDARADYLRYIMKHGQWSILEEGASLQKKLMERQPEVHFIFAF